MEGISKIPGHVSVRQHSIQTNSHLKCFPSFPHSLWLLIKHWVIIHDRFSTLQKNCIVWSCSTTALWDANKCLIHCLGDGKVTRASETCPYTSCAALGLSLLGAEKRVSAVINGD